MRAMRMASSLPLSNRTMGLIDKLKRTFVTPLVEEKEEGMAMVRSLREPGRQPWPMRKPWPHCSNWN